MQESLPGELKDRQNLPDLGELIFPVPEDKKRGVKENLVSKEVFS